MNNLSADIHARSRKLRIHFADFPLSGFLLIGDPHIEGRTPGFRRDNYPETILHKLHWCLDYASQHELQPILLGDVFDKPRDNPNWLVSRLLDLMSARSIPTIFGNHDCANPVLDENDTLMLLAKAGAVQLLDATSLWFCEIEGRSILIGGSPYRYEIPSEFFVDLSSDVAWNPAPPENWSDKLRSALVIWLTHHDLTFPNADEAVVTNLYEIPGVDYVINGHIHRRASADVVRGQTTWINPGNIARRSRSDSIRGHVPAVLRMDITRDGQWFHYIHVPHEPAEEVFFDLDNLTQIDPDQSKFVSGLAMLETRKTQSGAGLLQFLTSNLAQFEPDVAEEILRLAEVILNSPNVDLNSVIN